ncbi:MAG: hypothetical protein CVT81_02980 [Alphaproteobacteria bacterium HGW-Alphaproteobacteria-3]|nr:MAG: hypothetical protein CVT81_02980 [Alphaproteobacteria bacterium HGW-Alphaproteobacteria-3]
MRKPLLSAEGVQEARNTSRDARNADDLAPRLRSTSNLPGNLTDADDEAVAAYLLDLMIASRRMADKRGFGFLAYLIGVAAEESRLLMLGRSATGRGGDEI